MAEIATPPPPTNTREGAPRPETGANREQVIKAVSNAGHRWDGKVEAEHNRIDPFTEIDDLADTGSLTLEQKQMFGAFRNYQKGVRAINGLGVIGLYPARDTLTASFRNPDTGELIKREERLDIADLISSARDDIEKKRADVEKNTAEGRSGWYVDQSRKDLADYEAELRVLEENSEPAFPNGLDESSPEVRGRIEEEARRIAKNPLTATGSDDGNWQAAKERLGKARLLNIPAARPVEQNPADIRIRPDGSAVRIPRPTRPGTVRAEATITPTPTKTPTPTVTPTPTSTPTARGTYGPGPSGGGGGPELSAAAGTETALAEAALQSVRTMGFGEAIKQEPATAGKVLRLLKTRLPEFNKRNLRLMLLPLAAALLAIGIPRDTYPTGKSPDSAVSPVVTPVSPGLVITPETSIRPGMKLPAPGPSGGPLPVEATPTPKPSVKLTSVDYSIRGDYPSAEGYSVRGMVESDIARVMNSELAKQADKLEEQGKPLAEDNPALVKTIELARQKLDAAYGQGTYDSMVADFTQEMKNQIAKNNPKPVLGGENNGQILDGKFDKWDIGIHDLDAWLRYRHQVVDPNQIGKISAQVTQEVTEGGANNATNG